MKRADVAVCIHVTQGEGNHGGAVRARSRLLHVPARQTWQRKLGKLSPFAAQEGANQATFSCKKRRSDTSGIPEGFKRLCVMTKMTGNGC
jgi:hypothetical protein